MSGVPSDAFIAVNSRRGQYTTHVESSMSPAQFVCFTMLIHAGEAAELLKL